ncbi:MAG TPA: quinoprotein relay system zinc metallohydrolase 2 [Methylocella sp.]|nr:quinoprotein relay system zinc metallohydrolase 2 [Methylocella sp.]
MGGGGQAEKGLEEKLLAGGGLWRPATQWVGASGTNRRTFLAGGFCLCCLPAATHAGTAPSFAVEEIAPGIHFRRGVDEDASHDNGNAIANIGFVVGKAGVLVLDPGGCLADGERLRAGIVKTTSLPIKYVVMSHVHPDHIFGACAFLCDSPVFVGHARLKDMLHERGAYYREKLQALLGPEQAAEIVMPGMEVAVQAEIDLGGRTLEVTAHEPSHTVCDLSLFDKTTGVLMAGDLLFIGRIPALDGSLRGWLKTLDKLTGTGASRVVPGHGPTAADWPSAATPLKRYLATLERDTRQAIDRGIGLDEAVKQVASSERGAWTLFDEYNARNTAEAYRELEWE